QRTIGGKQQRERPAAKTAAKGKTSALVVPLDLFKEHTHHRAVRLVADEKLLLERPEFAARQIARDSRCRLTHLAVRKINCRRLKLRNFFGLDHHAAAALGLLRLFAHHAASGRVPLVANWMAEKRAWP